MRSVPVSAISTIHTLRNTRHNRSGLSPKDHIERMSRRDTAPRSPSPRQRRITFSDNVTIIGFSQRLEPPSSHPRGSGRLMRILSF